MKFFVLILNVFIALQVSAKTTLVETRSYDDVFTLIEALEEKIPSNEILVVFDVDDTLLVIEHCLHNGKMTKGIAKLYHCPSEPTEADLAVRINSIQNRGINTIALTARGSSFIRSTERELNRQKMDFFESPFSEDLQLEVPKKKCSKKETHPCFTNVRFTKGVTYAQGSKKGVTLKALLEKLNQDYKHIVFVDDRDYNISAVNEVYGPLKDVHAHLFLYLKHRD